MLGGDCVAVKSDVSADLLLVSRVALCGRCRLSGVANERTARERCDGLS